MAVNEAFLCNIFENNLKNAPNKKWQKFVLKKSKWLKIKSNKSNSQLTTVIRPK